MSGGSWVGTIFNLILIMGLGLVFGKVMDILMSTVAAMNPSQDILNAMGLVSMMFWVFIIALWLFTLVNWIVTANRTSGGAV
jgi:hypothetical protein